MQLVSLQLCHYTTHSACFVTHALMTFAKHALAQLVEDGRSRVRFPMESLLFFIDIILRPHCGPGSDPDCKRNDYPGGGKAVGVWG